MLAAGRAGYNIIFDVGFLNYNALNTVAPRFPKAQFAGIDIDYGLAARASRRTPRASSSPSSEAGYLVGYLAGLQIKKQGGKQIISAVGAQQRAGDRALHQRLHPGRQEGEPRDQGARQLRERPDVQRPGEVPRDGAQPDPAGLAGRLPGRRRLRARRARGGEGERDLGHRRRRRPAATSARS